MAKTSASGETHTHIHTSEEPGAPETPEDVNTHIHTHISHDGESASPIILNVHQRLRIAMAEIDRRTWTKDLSNNQYKSIPIDQMRAGVRGACIKAGLIHMVPLDLRYEKSVARTERGGTMTVYEGTAVIRFVNVDDPEDFIDFPTLGCAMDSGDKGPAKLVTNLIKNAYKAVFDIGEQGKDDIDSYSNEELFAEADRIAKRREEARPKPPEDECSQYRRQIGVLMKDHEQTIAQYKAKYGLVPNWTKEILIQCIAECKGVKP